MIFRLTNKLFKRIHERPVESDREASSPFLDWGADHFFVGGHRYILITNRASILSWVVPGKGINSSGEFIRAASEAIRICLEEYRFSFHYERIIAPAFGQVHFRKVGDRNLTGIMMDMVKHAKYHLWEGDLSPCELSRCLNRIPQCSRKVPFPVDAFAKLPH